MNSEVSSRVDATQFLGQDVVAHHAGRIPHAIALANADTGREYTWAELEARVARCAGAVRSEHSIAAGDRVAVIADNDPKVLELQFACMRVGAIFVPLNWRLAYEELAYQCDDADVSLVVHDDTWAGQATKLASERGVAALSLDSDGAVRDAARERCTSRRRAEGLGRRDPHPLHLGHDRPPEGCAVESPVAGVAGDQHRRVRRGRGDGSSLS